MRMKGGKKGKRSARNKSKGVYVRQLARTTASKHRRAIRREKHIEFFKANPDKGSPSQRKVRSKKVKL
jgi:hypothetical protein